jgi:hypothetical protein
LKLPPPPFSLSSPMEDFCLHCPHFQSYPKQRSKDGQHHLVQGF